MHIMFKHLNSCRKDRCGL